MEKELFDIFDWIVSMLKLWPLLSNRVETNNISLRKINYLCSQIDVECTESTTNKPYIVILKQKLKNIEIPLVYIISLRISKNNSESPVEWKKKHSAQNVSQELRAKKRERRGKKISEPAIILLLKYNHYVSLLSTTLDWSIFELRFRARARAIAPSRCILMMFVCSRNAVETWKSTQN